MKKILTLMALALVGVTAVAAPAKFGQVRAPRAAEAPRRLPPPSADFNIIKEIPASANAKTYEKIGYTLGDDGFQWMKLDLEGFLVDVGIDGDKIYVGPIISMCDYERSYMVGTISNGVAIFQFPQALGYYPYADSNEYAVVCDIYAEAGGYKFKADADQVLMYTINEDGTLTAAATNNNKILVDYFYEDGKWWGVSVGEVLQGTALQETPDAPPSSHLTETYNLLRKTNGHEVEVTIDGSDIAIAGIYTPMPDGTIRGTIEGQKAIFPRGQYLGVSDVTYSKLYAFPAEIRIYYDDLDGEIETLVPIDGDIEFTYDAEKHSFTPESYIYFSPSLDGVGALDYDGEFTIVKPDPSQPIHLQAPTNVSFSPKYGQYAAALYFSLPSVSGVNLLNQSQLYFSLFYDDEIFTLYPDEYYLVPDEGWDMVPYGFDNDLSIIYDPDYDMQAIAILADGWKTLGVQSVYKEESGNEIVSDVVYINASGEVEDSIEELSTIHYQPSTVYDLQGRKVAKPAHGLFITNGKIIKK